MFVCVRVSTRACMHMCAGTCTHEHLHRVAMGFVRTLLQTEDGGWQLHSCIIKNHRVKLICFSNEDFNIYHASQAWPAASCGG